MEEWFHENNSVEEVRSARPTVAKVIELIHKCFPREEGQGYNIPKSHGITKLQTFVCLLGSGINFFGGPGECNHKRIFKDMAFNTQMRVSEFVSQLGKRYHEFLVFKITTVTMENSKKRKSFFT